MASACALLLGMCCYLKCKQKTSGFELISWSEILTIDHHHHLRSLMWYGYAIQFFKMLYYTVWNYSDLQLPSSALRSYYWVWCVCVREDDVMIDEITLQIKWILDSMLCNIKHKSAAAMIKMSNYYNMYFKC